MRKGVQHLNAEQGKWNYDKPMNNMSALVHELDYDLLKEAEQDIKEMLFVRFFPKISKAARHNLVNYVRKL